MVILIYLGTSYPLTHGEHYLSGQYLNETIKYASNVISNISAAFIYNCIRINYTIWFNLLQEK